MALFDVLDNIAEKQVTKTDTGDNRIFGVVVGQVVDNYDQDRKGRVCVTVPTRDRNANELKWARVAMPSSGSSWGHFFLPEVGDQVLLVFEQGNIEKPYVIGCIPKDNDRILTQSADQDNQFKKIVTRHGNTIYFEDNKTGDGANDKIFIQTAKEEHRIELDNEKKTIRISDKEGKNQIEMKTETGQMLVKAGQKLTIQVGDSIELIMNGSNGKVSLRSTSLAVEASNSVDIRANSKAEVSAATVSLEANAMLKLNSSGAATLAGTPIKIG